MSRPVTRSWTGPSALPSNYPLANRPISSGLSSTTNGHKSAGFSPLISSRSAGEDALDPAGSAVDREALLAVRAGAARRADPEQAADDLGAEALPRFVVSAGTHVPIGIGAAVGVGVLARLARATLTAGTGAVVARAADLAGGTARAGATTTVNVGLGPVLDPVGTDGRRSGRLRA